VVSPEPLPSRDEYGFQPTRPENRDEALPGFDPADSPLHPGGRAPLTGSRPGSGQTSHLHGLTDFPSAPHPRQALYRVRREGWVRAREAARSRFRDLHEKGGPSDENRLLYKIRTRNGLLERARENAVRPRFNMRGGRP
jgi:hypothetical protein